MKYCPYERSEVQLNIIQAMTGFIKQVIPSSESWWPVRISEYHL